MAGLARAALAAFCWLEGQWRPVGYMMHRASGSPLLARGCGAALRSSPVSPSGQDAREPGEGASQGREQAQQRAGASPKLPEHGHGSILRYEGVGGWYSRFSHAGKEHVEALGTDDKKKALAAHREKVKLLGAAALSLTHFQSRAEKKRVTIGRLLDDYLTDCETRKLKGLPQIRSHAATVRALWGEYPAVTVDAPTVARQVKVWQKDEVADATINRRTQVLHAALALGKTNKLVIEVPEFTRLSEADNARQGFFRPEQVTKLLKHAPDYLADLIEFTALVGWRPKSSKALRWPDVDLKGKTITIGTSKNGRPQVLPIAGPLLGLLQRRDKARLYTSPDGTPGISEFVFHRGGQPIGDYRKAWARTLKAAGLPQGMLLYDLKRTAARGLRKQVDEQTAMAVMGQRTASIFQRYRIVDVEDKAEALRTLKAFA